MAKKVGLPNFVKSRHDNHFVDEISTRTRTAIIRRISVERITPNLMQPRKDFGNLEELSKSIKEKGIIEPIIVRPKNGKFEIIAGERRFKAAQKAGLKEIPCLEHNVADNEALEIALVENLQRKDLSIFESAFSLKTLAEIYGYTHEDIALKISKSRATVSELLRLTDIPADIVTRCQEMDITSKSFLLELAKLENKDDINTILDEYSEHPFSRDILKKKRKDLDNNNPETESKKSQEDKKKNIKFNFASDDKSVKIGFSLNSDNVKKERVIEILERLILDIKENNVKGFDLK